MIILKSLLNIKSYKYIYPNRSYIICLQDRLKNIKGKLDSRVIFKNAIDSRNNPKIYQDYNLKLDPADASQRLLFSKSRGAIGCFLSHYKIWKESSIKNDQWILHLEDDINILDANAFLQSKGVKLPKNFNEHKPQLILLNKRTKEKDLPFWLEGTEAFMYNKAAAIAFLHNIYDSNFLSKSIRKYYLCDAGNSKDSVNQSLIQDKNKDFSQKNAIRYVAYRFLGHCSLPECPEKYRVNITLSPQIGLSPISMKSQVLF